MEVNFETDVTVVGGGAAGYFTALQLAEASPGLRIRIVERGKHVLEKVRISGGGRCNVTHACFDPKTLSQHYPRGQRELVGPFHQFNPADTITWFENHGVALKIEADGRMFPITDSSATIVDCFVREAQQQGIELRTSCSVTALTPLQEGWTLHTTQGPWNSRYVVLTTGSNPKIWQMLADLGHPMVAPVPSLFTFHCDTPGLRELAGIAVEAETQVKAAKLSSRGPVLMTHWGLSGPGILRLSAWGARWMHEQAYRFTLQLNWCPDRTTNQIMEHLKRCKALQAKKEVKHGHELGFPNRFWLWMLDQCQLPHIHRWADLSGAQLQRLAEQLTQMQLPINGKSTFKEEFVTAGGVNLKAVHWKNLESKYCPGLFMAGEILDVDGITGGFNFQNAWTGGALIGRHLAEVFNADAYRFR